MNSFMSWVGGKKALREVILERFPLEYTRYIEVFGGGGWVLFYKPPGKDFEVYNDRNRNLVNLYRCVKQHPMELIDELTFTLNAREEFEYAKQVLETREDIPDIERAAYYYQIICQSYASGLDSFAAQPRSMWSKFPLIMNASARLQGVVIENRDFERVIRQYDRPESFFYCDPPYYATEDYYKDVGFTTSDHERLADCLAGIEGKFLLSYNDCPEIRDLYDGPEYRIESLIGRFLTAMNGYDGMKLRNPFLINPYNAPKLFDRKYIPEETAHELDQAFMKTEIPLHLRCIYWTLRLIPSRISEVLGMRIDCVKPFDDHYCIMIPTWKQNGGYAEPIVRTIHVRQEGMGEFLLSLLWEQQKRAYAYQEYMVPEEQGYLLTYRQQIELNGLSYDKDRFMLATWTTVSWGLNKVCKKYGVCDTDGKPYRVTSHQFRHNGITDRLIAGFTPAEIADMTGHHGTAMILNSYAHLNLFPETLADPIRYRKEGDVPKDRILFCGRILSMNRAEEMRLLRNLRSHRVPGGICSDVSHCKSGMWNCVACENFIPEAEQVDWFRAQAKDWNDKAERFCSEPAMAETFRMNAARFSEIVNKIQNMEAEEHEKEDS